MSASYGQISGGLARHGLIARGGFRPGPEDGLAPGIATVVLVGNAGAAMWPAFAAARPRGPDPMNRWTRRVLDALAAELGATALYPFEKGGHARDRWLPFQRWARKAEPVFPSPIGLLIHPRHGLMHAYRGALAFACEVEGLPEREDARSPCEDCAGKPCLQGCPVGAFDGSGYDVARCAAHLRRAEGADCMALGCRARRACPVGRDAAYPPPQAAFHMAAFLRARTPS